MDYDKTLDDLEKILTELREENKTIPIIVEGEKDIEALRKLEITGKIIQFNRGMSIPDFCDMISQEYTNIIILTDWDKKGGYLCSTIRKNLESRVKCDIKYRAMIAKRSKIRTIEGLPSWIESLRLKMRLE
jgi:5S rRNA maturation endonuclease (ribonuclease M5)